MLDENMMHLFRSPPHAPSVTSDSDCESDPFPPRRSRVNRRSLLPEERLQRVAEFAEQVFMIFFEWFLKLQ